MNLIDKASNIKKAKKEYEQKVLNYIIDEYNKEWVTDDEDKLNESDVYLFKLLENKEVIAYGYTINMVDEESIILIKKFDCLIETIQQYYDNIIDYFKDTELTYINDDYLSKDYFDNNDMYINEQGILKYMEVEST